MKKLSKLIVPVVLVGAIVAAAVFFGPKIVHTCDNCADVFVGAGYSANVVSNAITSLTGQEDKILCKDCAAKEHAVAIAAGKSLDDFKRPLFEEKTEN